MNLNQVILYNEENGFVSNVHPINKVLSIRQKIEVLAQFEMIQQSVRHDHDNVIEGFSNLINMINSPN